MVILSGISKVSYEASWYRLTVLFNLKNPCCCSMSLLHTDYYVEVDSMFFSYVDKYVAPYGAGVWRCKLDPSLKATYAFNP